MDKASELLTVAEAASLLTLKVSTIRAWVYQHRIPYVKLGRLVRIRRSDLDALIAECVVSACSENATGVRP
jgi:excisionase family DNA binding protein